MTDKIVVFCTCESAEQAEQLARRILEARLAACVNVVPSIQSYYWWQGKIDSSQECLLVIKTSRALLSGLRAKIEALHSYQVPEVIALTIVDGAPNYLHWMEEALTPPSEG